MAQNTSGEPFPVSFPACLSHSTVPLFSLWKCFQLTATQYYRFEAFDEPWKVIYNTPGKEWEDKWGLMDSGRNLKSGLSIPDCGGKTAS